MILNVLLSWVAFAPIAIMLVVYDEWKKKRRHR